MMTHITSFRKKFIVGAILCFLVCFLLPVGLVNSASTSTTSTNELITSTPATSTPPIENGVEGLNGFFPLGNGNGGTIFEDDFNSYTDGDLNGQGDWVGSVKFDIQPDVVFEGAKAVEMTYEAGTVYIKKTGTQKNDGRITICLKNTSTGGNNLIELYEDAIISATIGLHLTGNVIFYDGTVIPIQSYSAYIWYCIEIEWRSSDHKFRVRVNGGTWIDWIAGQNDWIAGLNKVGLLASADGVVYVDYIAEYPYTPPPPPELAIIENVETGASFFIRKTLSYGRIIIILLLVMLLIFEITKFLTEIIIPQKLNFRK